ncbi:unnamed protein product [Vicia faba]|uniref:Uncharacterized protein n=1 Tax=Vicia faba TaxID=3906 RepID=A0AAV0YXB3_VICFA|nr:unnamed protein product [Vicia faba]
MKQLQEHPLRTKSITAGVLSGISDIVLRSLLGLRNFNSNDFLKVFQLILEKIFEGKKDSKTVANKVLIEQLTSSPFNNFLFMIYYGLVIEGQPWVHVKARVKKGYPSVQYASWMGNIFEPSSTIYDID